MPAARRPVPPAADLITAASQAFSVMDFEPVARKNIPIGHWGYLAGGADDDGTVRANREGFAHYQLRPRRLIDVSKVDTSVSLMGKSWETPIVLNPLGTHKAFHAEGEPAVARAAKAKKHLMVLSTMSTTSIEDVTAARGEAVWFQLYSRNDWGETRAVGQARARPRGRRCSSTPWICLAAATPRPCCG